MARNNEIEGAMNTIIGKGSSLEGKMTVAQSIRIDGSFKGEINASDTLIVGTTGELSDVSINVKNAIIGGKIKGNITASSKVTLESSSRLEGDLTAKLLVIEEGSLFSGNCTSGEKAVAQAQAQAPQTTQNPMAEKPKY
ncbi:polymer-forming cytoskeletal protein [Candidatus Latescibacterota bacterium]